MSKLLYIGAGLDLNPLKHFPNTREFVFIDTLPRSEFDSDTFVPEYFNSNFVSKLISGIKMFGFEFEYMEELDSKYFVSILSLGQRIRWINQVKQTFPQINPTLIVFYNHKTSQEVKYYLSTNIMKNICSKLVADIETSTGLIISGYHPDKLILQLISRPISLYGYTQTAYDIKPDELENIDSMFAFLFQNLHLVKSYFDKIYMVGVDYGHINRCDSLVELDKLAKLDYLDRIDEADEFDDMD